MENMVSSMKNPPTEFGRCEDCIDPPPPKGLRQSEGAAQQSSNDSPVPAPTNVKSMTSKKTTHSGRSKKK
jgi:hypothetical protein